MSQPIFEWTFDGNVWPEKSFFGRRWVELFEGKIVTPSNGCLYFWGCILSTIFWFLRGSLFFQLRKGITYVDKKIEEANAKKQHEQIKRMTPPIFTAIGRGIHFLCATKFSPLRLLGVGTFSILEVIGSIFGENRDLIIGSVLLLLGAALVIGAIVLIVLFPIQILVLLAFLVIGSAVMIAAAALLYWIFSSDWMATIGRMIKASKDRVCPAIRIV